MPVNTPSVMMNPCDPFVICCVAIPNVFADKPSVSYDAVVIRGISLALFEPVMRTTIPFSIVKPELLSANMSVCVVRSESDDVAAYDEDNALSA
jgi:hypothetical protein